MPHRPEKTLPTREIALVERCCSESCARMCPHARLTPAKRQPHQISTIAVIASPVAPQRHTAQTAKATITMDQLNISPETAQGLQNLSAQDKQQLNQFVVNESQKAQIQQSRYPNSIILPNGSLTSSQQSTASQTSASANASHRKSPPAPSTAARNLACATAWIGSWMRI